MNNPHPTTTCPDCGNAMDARSKRCRDCFRGTLPTCRDCGKQLGRDGQKQCRPCWMAEHTAKSSRPTCTDCGKRISWLAKRCWEHEMQYRSSKSIRVQQELMRAVRSDLKNPNSRKNRLRRWNAIPLRRLLGPKPCASCGYDKLPSRVHRLDPEKGYVLGNVVQVCPRCHDEVHAKLRVAPIAATL